jgi:membrane fusion protein, hemolysin D
MPNETDNDQDENITEDHIFKQTNSVAPPDEKTMDSPIVIEILEEMPSYMARGFIYVLVAVCIIGILYAYLGKMDVIVQGQGKLVPKGDAEIVQSAKNGRLTKLFVKVGDTVKADQILAELDLTQTNIGAKKREREFIQMQMEMACLVYAIDVMNNVLGGEDVHIDGTKMLKLCASSYVESITGLKRERRTYEKAMLKAGQVNPGQLETLIINYDNKKMNVAYKQNKLAAAERDLNRAESQLALYEEMYQKGLTSKVKLLEEQKRLDDAGSLREENLVALNTAKKEMYEAEQEVKKTRINHDTEKKQAVENYQIAVVKYKNMIEGMNLKLGNIKNAIANFELDSKLQKYTDQFNQITAPVSGRIASVNLRTPGQMISAGTTLFTLNPANQPLVAKVMIPNKSIGQIRIGLKAKLKLEAFPYQNYGVLGGRVIEISPDSIRIQNGYFYEVTVATDQDFLIKNKEKYQLFTGLTMTAEIVVQKTRILENFIAPLKKLKG